MPCSVLLLAKKTNGQVLTPGPLASNAPAMREDGWRLHRTATEDLNRRLGVWGIAVWLSAHTMAFFLSSVETQVPEVKDLHS